MLLRDVKQRAESKLPMPLLTGGPPSANGSGSATRRTVGGHSFAPPSPAGRSTRWRWSCASPYWAVVLVTVAVPTLIVLEYQAFSAAQSTRPDCLPKLKSSVRTPSPAFTPRLFARPVLPAAVFRPPVWFSSQSSVGCFYVHTELCDVKRPCQNRCAELSAPVSCGYGRRGRHRAGSSD